METIYSQDMTVNISNKNEASQRYTNFPLCSHNGNLTDAEAIRIVAVAVILLRIPQIWVMNLAVMDPENNEVS